MSNLTDFYQQISENLQTAVLLLNHQMEIRYMNPAGEILFDLSSRKVINQSLETLLPERNQPSIQEFYNKIRTGRPFSLRDIAIRLHDQSTINVDCTTTPLPDQTLLEISRKGLHHRIAHEQNLLSQNHSARLLVRNLAHEIKNPLGGVCGAAQLLERELDDDELKEYTQVIISEGNRLKTLVDRLLGPTDKPRHDWLSIHEVLERVHQLLVIDKPEDITLARDYDPSIPLLYADRDQLIQVVLNIANNALHAMGTTGTLLFRTRTERQYTIGHQYHKLVLRVDIVDNGPGVDQSLIEQIFYPTVSGDPHGTGLGLSIAQSIMNRHQGIIECQSQAGKTCFSLLIPLET
jgi:two-component system, NtrC family, nitrogen regulation sensor histidine kinase GlnL